ncbi:MAG: hypothetical protein HXY40_08100 [Chloroflexi bacterium]|nr:hypothetical protein [Chloroflexota bacterium]
MITSAQNTQLQEQVAQCPSCNEDTTFTYRGEQRWPERVAQALGVAPEVQLWICNQCHTTISTPESKAS